MNRRYVYQPTVFICLVMLLLGCGKKQGDDNCLLYTKAPVIEVKGDSTALINQEVEVTAFFGVSNGCGRFDKFEETTTGNTTTITLNAKYEGCLCTQIAPILSGIYKFKKSQAGTYVLKFWQGDSFIDHTIIVQ